MESTGLTTPVRSQKWDPGESGSVPGHGSGKSGLVRVSEGLKDPNQTELTLNHPQPAFNQS